MPISSVHFRRAYERFQRLHEAKCGKRLRSFADPESWAYEREAYKLKLLDDARRAMSADQWQEVSVGRGAIVDAVVRAIELQGNNLVQWEPRQGPQSRAHNRMLEARHDDEKRRRLDRLLFDLYRHRRADEATFEGLVYLCGKHYALLGYLFFLAVPDRFLPLRTKTFDKALQELGVPLTTGRSCSWENYQRFLDAMFDVQQRLHLAGIHRPTLLDAHSFCWILGNNGAAERGDESIPILPFGGVMLAADAEMEIAPRDEAESVDLSDLDERKRASGARAENIALVAERQRLRDEGRADLAERVESVVDRPGLGFDLRSFDCDGTERCIEVKNVSNATRFYLTQGEWQSSRARPNYWFYLVSATDGLPPSVTSLSANALRREHLRAVLYLVSFSRVPAET